MLAIDSESRRIFASGKVISNRTLKRDRYWPIFAAKRCPKKKEKGQTLADPRLYLQVASPTIERHLGLTIFEEAKIKAGQNGRISWIKRLGSRGQRLSTKIVAADFGQLV